MTGRLTARSLITGAFLGAPLAVCNIYTGLKIGWGFNMSVAAVLCGYAIWRVLGPIAGGSFSIYESNLNQTAASAAASISSAGLVAAIPALALIAQATLTRWQLFVWLLSVSLVGVVVAVALRRSMLELQALPFPHGVAAAELLRQLHGEGGTARSRVSALSLAAVAAALVKLLAELVPIRWLAAPGMLSLTPTRGTIRQLRLSSLGFGAEPGLMIVGAGAIVGPRVGLSMALGSLLTWLWLVPALLESGAVPWPADDRSLYQGIIKGWLVWPGVALMVTSALTSFALSSAALLRPASSERLALQKEEDPLVAGPFRRPRLVLLLSIVAVGALSVVAQASFFGIEPWVGTLAVLMSFLLAVVAGRVSGETGITPKGPLGKVTQLTFGLLEPALPAANLMTANVTAGAAAQCGDLLHDLKAGALIGAAPWRQVVAQVFGVVVGALVGGVVYPALVPNPAETIGGEMWPAPAVMMWKAVAELLASGTEGLPAGALFAGAIAGALGVALAIADKLASVELRRKLPVATSLGLAMVLPPYVALAIFAGGMVSWAVGRRAPEHMDMVIVVGSGLIAGESLVGAGLAVRQTLRG